MDTSPHILVVDDHDDIRDALKKYLVRNGLRVSVADGGRAMRQVLKSAAIDLVVLDIMMPGEDGLTLCRQIRETVNLPVILLTAMAEETDRIIGLEIGADDYLTKPFNPRELLARIKAVLRRAGGPAAGNEATAPSYRFDRWTLDVDRREISAGDGIAVSLSTAEFRLLHVLLQRPRMVLSREQLLDLTSGRGARVFDRSIDNMISKLRKKIEIDPKSPVIIQTEWGGGYRLAVDVEALE